MSIYLMIESAIIITISIAMLIFSKNYSAAAAVLPRLTAIVMIILSSMLFYSSFRKYRAGDRKPLNLINPRIMKFFLIVVAYLAGVRYVGFYVSTAVYLGGSGFFLGEKPKNIALSVSIFLIFCYVFFYRILGLKLPAGLLI